MQDDFFTGYSAVKDACIAYGFQSRGDTLQLDTAFFEGAFLLRLTVATDSEGQSHVSYTVFDADTGEEYYPLRLLDAAGAYVHRVKSALDARLVEIRSACFASLLFASPQARRLAANIAERYGEHAVFPWSRPAFRGNGVFRRADNEKWYALILPVAWSKVVPGKAGGVTLLNVKCPAEDIAEAHGTDGIYPAYHMNKRMWISIALDDRVDDATALAYIERSRALVAKGAKANKKQARPAAWVVPANPKYFDVFAAFDASPVLEWKQAADTAAGETVYIYMGAPYSAIVFETRARRVHIPCDGNGRTKEVMELELVRHLPHDAFPRTRLIGLGLTNIRGTRTVPANVHEAIQTFRCAAASEPHIIGNPGTGRNAMDVR